MSNLFRQQARDTPQSGGFLASILQWLIGIVQLTEEEQGQAGIYLGDQYPPDNIHTSK
jgi:hypothetical protein